MSPADSRAPTPPRRLLAGAVQGLFYAAYPLVIYVAHTRWATRQVAALVLGLLAVSLWLRLRSVPAAAGSVVRPHLPLAALVLAAIALDERVLLLLLPVLVSGYLCATFGWSLVRGPSMIERFARLIEDDLPDFTLPYCRGVTVLWCVFLGANALAVALLAAAAPVAWWALYTGAGFYVLLALLLALEYVVRKLWFRYYGDGLADRVLARWFPPEATANGRRSLAYVERRRATLASPQ